METRRTSANVHINCALNIFLFLCVFTTARAFAPHIHRTPSDVLSVQKLCGRELNNYHRSGVLVVPKNNLGSRRKIRGTLYLKSSDTSSIVEEQKLDSASTIDNKKTGAILPEEQVDTSKIVDEKECSISPQPEEELSETKKLLKQVKEAGTAGVISYALWELGFWALSVPVCISAYYGLFGHFPDLTNKEDLSKLGGEAFAFVNFARFAVPLRIGLALSTTPWIQENVVDKFFNKKKNGQEEDCQES
jgi:hypothetical protein